VTSSLVEEEILTVMDEAARDVKRQTGVKFGLGLDIAAASLWNPRSKLYVYRRSNILRTRDEQIEFVENLVKRFNLLYVEDPLHDKDFQGFTELTMKCDKTLICGDDLYVTSISRLMLGTSEKAGNAVIIKPNQVGDITGSARAVELARNNGFKIIVSHRSGETPTDHLAHIAVAFEADMIKTGVIGGERVVKHNELIRLESEGKGLTLAEMKI